MISKEASAILTTEDKDEESDALYAKALEIIKTEGKASTSFLQRKLANWLQ